jgi:hypothetical protein
MFRAVCGIWAFGQEMHYIQWSEGESSIGALWSSVSSSPYAMPVNITSSFEATAFKPDPNKSGNHDLLCRCRVDTRSLPEVA